jgi:hypothetical protein
MSLATNNWAQSGQRKEVKMIKNDLLEHKKIMNKLILEGFSKNEASRRALIEMKAKYAHIKINNLAPRFILL